MICGFSHHCKDPLLALSYATPVSLLESRFTSLSRRPCDGTCVVVDRSSQARWRGPKWHVLFCPSAAKPFGGDTMFLRGLIWRE